MKKIETIIKIKGFILIILALLFNPFLFKYISKNYIGWEFNILFYGFLIFIELCLIFIGIIIIKNPKKIIKLAPSILLSFITIIICIFFITIILNYFVRPNMIDRIYSSEFHHMYKPNSFGYRYPDPNDEFDKVYITTNELGMRGSSIPLEKKEKRVLILGDSFMHADEIPFKKTVGQILQSKFEKEDYLILQQGYSSWSPLLELNFLIKNYEKLQPDHVFLVLVANDFYDSHFSASDFMYSKQTIFDEKGYPLEFNVSLGSENLKQKFLQSNSVRSLINIFKKPPKCKNIINQKNIDSLINLKNTTKDYTAEILNDYTLCSLENLIRLSRPHDKWDEKTTKIVDLGLENVNKMNKFLREKNASLTLLLTPLGWNVHPDETNIGKQTRYYCFDENVFFLDDGIRNKIKEFVIENNMGYIELRDIMISFRNKNPDKKLFFQSDGHWNERGHNLLGNSLYLYLTNINDENAMKSNSFFHYVKP